MTNPSNNPTKALTTFGIILTLSAAALTGGLTGCASDRHSHSRDDHSRDERTDDQADSSRVRHALAADTQYKYGNIDVRTYKGVVQLTGFVNSRDQKNRAGELAKGVAGIRDVENNITVKESAN